MRAEVAKPKVTPSQILDEMTRLSARQLETVIQGAALLRLRKQKRVLESRESDLLQIINRGLSQEKNSRLRELEQKLRDEAITRAERAEFLRLTHQLEKLAAERLKALTDLATVRKTSVSSLMQELGLIDGGYA